MKKTSLKANFLYSISYQLLTIILPFITVPYISRVLGASGVGVYSYTYAIVNYFMLFGLLGINNYGNRTIAKCKKNKEMMSKNFWEIYSVQLIMSAIVILAYLLYVFVFESQYQFIAIIQTIYLIANLLDINWFFFGLEKFKITVTRNFVIKIISVVCIFIFVKNADDLWIYTLILSISTLISQLVLFPFLKKEVKLVLPQIKSLKKHIKPIIALFLPVIAVSLYKIMDKIMLGNLSTVVQVGYYEQAEKIINVPLGLITALGSVMMPRISALISEKQDGVVQNYISKSVQFLLFLAFPICFGLIATAGDFVPIFLGKDFVSSIPLVYLLAITIVFLAMSNVIRTQYLIPKEKDKVYIISVVIGAIVNLIINLLLIPKYHAVGACIGTICAEFGAMFYQLIMTRKELPIKSYLLEIFPFFLKALVMFIIVILVKFLPLTSGLKVIVQVLTGILLYFVLNIKYINSIFNIKDIMKKLLNYAH